MNWKDTLGAIAPTLATAVGGPVAGLAVKTMLAATGLSSEKELADAVVSGDPEVLYKIKQAELDFDQRMAELGIERDKIGAQDRASARDMAKSTTLWPQIILSCLFVGGYFALIFTLFSGQFVLDDSIRDMSNILLGVLTAGIPMILRFWFGGSPGDDSQMEKIYNSVPK